MNQSDYLNNLNTKSWPLPHMTKAYIYHIPIYADIPVNSPPLPGAWRQGPMSCQDCCQDCRQYFGQDCGQDCCQDFGQYCGQDCGQD